ncbi:putative glutamate--cysteine ligase 2 [Dictyobacter alpinus]|uniref:Putative glutamate--cysteine ligase 2 n=1 Tax=Dictyobacter alpinus TaxID=2014873 RepID=A0A402BGW5_9CHLR|nr:carboxylate-amine ligase [Dictyobacter alpinus]GCE30664.1 putative glutamate--cysteine ligase 2 [Dictyobacter alpinus]
MSFDTTSWTIGIEEEYQIIDPITRALSPSSSRILSLVEPEQQEFIDTEMQSSQIETATPICHTLTEVRSSITHVRQALLTAAARANCWIAASGTHPFSHWQDQHITDKHRYALIEQRYQQLAREQVILGCHVHIGCPDHETALQIVNRARLWLTPLLALSANSPFLHWRDTGYASFRTMIWSRWPMAGPPPYIDSSASYDSLIRALIKTNAIENASHIYWDIRLSERYPTIEFRIMDVCMTIDETVMLAGLIRALVQTCAEQARQGIPYPHTPNEILRTAHWRAARYGLESELIDANAGTSLPAQELIKRFLTLLRPVLQANAEWNEIAGHVQRTLTHGNGAMRQRMIFQKTGRLQDVVDFMVAETAEGTAQEPLILNSQNQTSSY